jgi:DNA-binding FrmR family transcriptional regulator
MTQREKNDLSTRLRRIAGQVVGIQRMVDDGRAATEVANQVEAAKAALGKVASILLTSQLEERAKEAVETESPRERRELIDELVRMLERRNS